MDFWRPERGIHADRGRKAPRVVIEKLLRYEPETGKLIWLVDRPNGVKAGDEAGSVRKDGYRYVCVEDQRYFAQVVCWRLKTDQWPEHMVDHRNGIRDDNRWVNLRPASRSQNGYNAKRRSDNTTGVKGVYPYNGKFRAKINVSGRPMYLGTFETIEAAAEARDAAERQHHGEFAR